MAWALLLAAAYGCGHTHAATDKPKGDESQKSQSSPKEDKDESNKAEPKRHSGDETAARKKESAERPRTGDAQGHGASPPLAVSPAGLLRPGAATKIQDRLKGGGYLKDSDESDKLDGATESALRTFQRDHGLPATGMPDAETVRKLGLSVDDVFRSSEPAKH